MHNKTLNFFRLFMAILLISSFLLTSACFRIVPSPTTPSPTPDMPHPNVLTVNLKGMGNVAKNPDQPSYNAGTSAQLTATANPEWTFDGWSGDLTGNANPVTIIMDKSKTITATFSTPKSLQYILAVNVSGGGSISKEPDKTYYNAGESILIKANPSASGIFLGWSGDLSGSANPSTIKMDSNKMVNATFDQYPNMPNSPSPANYATGITTFTLSWTGGDPNTEDLVAYDVYFGTSSPPSLLFSRLSDTKVTQPFPIPSPGTKCYWKVVATDNHGLATEGPIWEFTMDTNTFPPYKINIVVTPTGSGNVNPPGGSFAAGQKATFTAIANTGWRFSSWNSIEKPTNLITTNPLTLDFSPNLTENHDITVIATFVQTSALSTSVSPVGSGTVNPSSGNYDSGTSVLLTVTPASGYAFDHWSGDASGTSNTNTITMNSNKNVVANFKQLYIITNPPSGLSTGATNQTLTYSTIASTNITGSLEYLFDWGDGSNSGWVSSSSASHSWSSAGTYSVKAQARVSGRISEWSINTSLTITSSTPQIINPIIYSMPPGYLNGSWVTYGNYLTSGQEFKGTLSLSGTTPYLEWSSTWTFSVYDPEDNLVDRKSYTFSSGAVLPFNYTASHAGTWKVRVDHASNYSRNMKLYILPAGWSRIASYP